MDFLISIGKRVIPKSAKWAVGRFVASLPLNPFSKSITPPRRLSLLYGDDEDSAQLGRLRHRGLKPYHKVLDVGCGAGRMAIPLTTYLDKAQGGSYDGFDIVPHGIKFCQRRITPKFPHFQFQQADIHNRFYNPKGRYKASEYRFPFNDNIFDMVYLTSVFTHMHTQEVKHYMSEINRVLKPGGKSFITYFLLNDETKNLMMSKVSYFNFCYQIDERCYTADPNVPEAVVAYDDTYILEQYGMYCLNLCELDYGCWRVYKSSDHTLSGNYWDYQDLAIAVKIEK
jgi:ubiquinone/menaquinone biosynthesis C-methylase UbiE